MRIVGGRFRGKRLTAPEGRDVRPTSDRVREAVFNILAHGIDGGDPAGKTVLDLFCGTGALGLEALSRGAAKVILVDADAATVALARRNAGLVGAPRDVLTLRLDATRMPPPPRIAGAPVDLVFLDPPYGQGLAGPSLLALVRRGWIVAGALAVVELGADEDFEPPAGFLVLDDRRYGAARVVFLRHGAG
ncbi:MAG: 16S rRNA (guanine(966)-N(2))-methyltransferase RsmD [Hyphomicrobiales bacterium]|nr:16S rRNA (guanine(966)-N(2))-methyltransferase RsmD [Hyphomicrobiales bacterium]MCP5371130.1 16S rRNA (guanine(966)-N(2))-methyltransferase RsmD [Hyphomicrobiales bacterium]